MLYYRFSCSCSLELRQFAVIWIYHFPLGKVVIFRHFVWNHSIEHYLLSQATILPSSGPLQQQNCSCAAVVSEVLDKTAFACVFWPKLLYHFLSSSGRRHVRVKTSILATHVPRTFDLCESAQCVDQYHHPWKYKRKHRSAQDHLQTTNFVLGKNRNVGV